MAHKFIETHIQFPLRRVFAVAYDVPLRHDDGMRPLGAILLAVVILAPCSVASARVIDALTPQAKQEHEARHAEMQEIQERVERRNERQLQREIEHPSTDEDDDDLDDDPANHPRRH